jgi:hypothetical protein
MAASGIVSRVTPVHTAVRNPPSSPSTASLSGVARCWHSNAYFSLFSSLFFLRPTEHLKKDCRREFLPIHLLHDPRRIGVRDDGCASRFEHRISVVVVGVEIGTPFGVGGIVDLVGCDRHRVEPAPADHVDFSVNHCDADGGGRRRQNPCDSVAALQGRLIGLDSTMSMIQRQIMGVRRAAANASQWCGSRTIMALPTGETEWSK